MQVGVNYPWRDYGWDFGNAPPAWRPPGAAPRWQDDIDSHLQRFRALGIDVVRWFVLGDGLTYGAGADAPRQRADGAWQFDPPPLAHHVVDHFEALLERFEAATAGSTRPLQLLPVLIDFHFCKMGRPVAGDGWVKGGRATALADTMRRQRFLDAVLEPLLAVSQRHPEAVYAWEVVNEPEWITAGWHPRWWRTQPVEEGLMRSFLDEATARIRRAGFKATVGFARQQTADALADAVDIVQVHHYARGRRALRPPPPDARPLTMLGEFATARSDTWPDLPDWDQGVLNRLRLAADAGYALALPWSFLSVDRDAAWSAGVEQDIARFTNGRSHSSLLRVRKL